MGEKLCRQMCCEVWPVGGARASPQLLIWWHQMKLAKQSDVAMKFGSDTYNCCWDMGSCKFWGRCRHVWRPFCGERKPKFEIRKRDFVSIGLQIVHAKFQENWTKFEGGDRFWSIWMKSKMAEISIWRLWRHRARWNGADCLIVMVSVMWKSVAWVKWYACKCTVKFDLLVALELWS